MALPSFVTSENVKFNGTLNNAVVLRNASGIKSLILWDNLTTADQDLLTAYINRYTGTTPLSAATAGKVVIEFTSAITGSTATGLSSVSSSTAGYATVNVGANKVGSTPSGLSTAAGTRGFNVVNFEPGIAAGTATGLLAPTSGYQTVQFTTARVGTDATGLANSATTYTSTVTVDGTARTVTVTGSAAQTITTLISAINTSLSGFATASLVSGNIRITSNTTGTSSSILAVTGTLWTAVTAFSAIGAAVAGTGNSVALTATVTINGVAYPISAAPAALTTFGDVVNVINTAIGANGTAAVSNGDIRVTSATFGATSKVVITAGTLFPALTGFVSVLPPSVGSGQLRTYSAVVVVDGTIRRNVNFTGVAGATFQNVIDEINTDLGGVATAALNGGNIRITSATTGITSSVAIYDSGFLFASLPNYAGFSYVAGVAPQTYTATGSVDNVTKPVSIVGSAAQTFGDLATLLQTAMSPATVAVSGGRLVITSNTTGTTSHARLRGGDLISSLSGVKSITVTDGAPDLVTAMKRDRTPAGGTYFDAFQVLFVGSKPAVPPNTPHNTNYRYFDGTVWRYLDNDAAI